MFSFSDKRSPSETVDVRRQDHTGNGAARASHVAARSIGTWANIPYHPATLQLKRGGAQEAKNERYRRKQDKKLREKQEEARRQREDRLSANIAPSFASTPENDTDPQNRSLTHRGLVETERVGGKKYVRTYQTVYADDQDGRFKDVHQSTDGDQRVKFSGGNAEGNTERCFNFGNPLRALDFAKTYVGQRPEKVREAVEAEQTRLNGTQIPREKLQEIARSHGRPIIRSFLVPHETYHEITSNTASESNAAAVGDYSKSVDKSRASDQYQLLGHDVKKLQDSILPGSLKSHVMDAHFDDYAADPRHGEVLRMSELSDNLGLPDAFGPFGPPMDGSKLLKPNALQSRAKLLNELFESSGKVERNAEPSEPFVQGLKDLNLPSELPTNPQQWSALRDQLSKAATAALIPSLIKEDYDSAASAIKGKDPVIRSGKRIRTKPLPRIEPANAPPPPKARLTPDEQQAIRDQRSARQNTDQDADLGDLFGDPQD